MMLPRTPKTLFALIPLVALSIASGTTIAAECISSTECYYTFSDNKYDPLDTSIFYEVTGDDYTPGCSLAGTGETQGHYFLPALPTHIGLDNFQIIPDSVPTNICYPASTDPAKIAVVSDVYGFLADANNADLYVKISIKDAARGTHTAMYAEKATMNCSYLSKHIAGNHDSTTIPGAFKITCE